MNTHIDQVKIAKPTSARQQVAWQLRELILSDKTPEGSKLPSAQELSEKWGVAYSSVHAALTMLRKEGLINRTRRLGTFVSKRSREMTTVGLYVCADIWRHPEAAYRRTLVSLLGERLLEYGIVLDVWVDPRPENEHGAPWTQLVRATEQRRIQGLICLSADPADRPWFSRLPVPVVGLTHRVNPDVAAGAELAVDELARLGCRSVGLISPESSLEHKSGANPGLYALSSQLFRRQAQEMGLESRDEWYPHRADGAEVNEGEAEHFGYEAMKRLLSMPERPEGVFVQYDWVARGALTAILESRIAVPRDLKLVFARNQEIRWLCPVPAAFVETSVAEIAQAMIELIMAQSRGEEIERPIIIKPRLITAASSSGVAADLEEMLVS